MHQSLVIAVFTNMDYHEMAGFAGVTLLVGSIWLRWRFSQICSDLEEDAKDAKITVSQAKTRMRVISVIGPLLLVLGVILLVWALGTQLGRLQF